MYLLILESIGTSELLLIGIVALIVFGPRKLPDMMRKFGKIMAEFRKTTSDFKQSWEQEVDIQAIKNEVSEIKTSLTESHQMLGIDTLKEEQTPLVPEIKEISADQIEFPKDLKKERAHLETSEINDSPTDRNNSGQTEEHSLKQDWL